MPNVKSELQDDVFSLESCTKLQDIQRGLREVLAGIPGNMASPTEIQRTLNLDMTLCWKIHRVVHAETPMNAGLHLPGRTSIRSFLSAAARQGVSSELIESALQSMDSFEKMVKIHAGDRTTFESMISAMVQGEDSDRVDLKHRRDAHRSARHIWGSSAKVRYACKIMQPGSAYGLLDSVAVQGYFGLRKFNNNARFTISHTRITDDSGGRVEYKTESLDPEGVLEHRIGFLQKFCSQPLPGVRSIQTDDNFIICELMSDTLGSQGDTDCVIGTISRNNPGFEFVAGVNETIKCYALVRMPSELLIHDIYIRKGTFASEPKSFAFAECGDSEDYPQIEENGRGIQFRSTVQKFGTGAALPHTPEVPKHRELVDYMFNHLEGDEYDFELYRIRIEYPVMPSKMLMQFELHQNTE